jgi:hypothetical protein
MRLSLRRVLPLAFIFTFASCIRIAGLPGEPPEGASASGPKRGPEPTRGLLRKRVAGKEAPSLLLAQDGTSCPVTPERFRDVTVGDHEVCVWQ